MPLSKPTPNWSVLKNGNAVFKNLKALNTGLVGLEPSALINVSVEFGSKLKSPAVVATLKAKTTTSGQSVAASRLYI